MKDAISGAGNRPAMPPYGKADSFLCICRNIYPLECPESYSALLWLTPAGEEEGPLPKASFPP